MSGGDDTSTGRRGFFRDAMSRMINPLADYIQERIAPEVQTARLRPPGAIEESRFLDTCYRCGKCVTACPADAIFLLDRASGDATGTPAIDPDRIACVLCDGLQCTQVCESGALVKLSNPHSVAMGLAHVYEPLCVRTQGQSCTLCVDQCPLGDSAIHFTGDGPPEILSPGCVGCGVCQSCCPTSPKAITVIPT